MINTYHYDNETWIDIDHGTPEEISDIISKHSIHPFVAKELTSATPKPRIEFHNGYVYCILHFPAIKHSHGPDKNQEVDFIIGKNLLITARYDTIDPLYRYAKMLEVKEVLDHGEEAGSHTIFVGMLRELYTGLFDELSAIEDSIESITHQIFTGKEHAMVSTISTSIRTLLDFKKTTDLHREILETLRARSGEMFGEGFTRRMESIILDYTKISITIKSNLDMLHELRDTNNSLLTTKQNEIVRHLTIISFLTLPITAIGTLFGMSVHHIPLIDNPKAFWMILTAMGTCVAITTAYIKYKKWM